MLSFRIITTVISITILFTGVSNDVRSQGMNLDTLKVQLNRESNDSIKATLLNNLAWEYKFRDLKESEKYCLQTIEFCTDKNFLKTRSSAYNTLGLVKDEQMKHEEALKYMRLSIKDKEQINDKKGIATVKNNMGVVYKNSGNSELALQYYKEALSEHEILGNLKGQGESLSNIGVHYRNSGDIDMSTTFFKKALSIYQELKYKNGIALVYNNLSANASDQNDFKTSINYLYESAKIFEELNNKTFLITLYGNIAKLNKELKNTKEAMIYCNKAMELGKSIGASQKLKSVYATKGDLEFELKKYKTALNTYSEGLKLTKDNSVNEYDGHLHLGKGACYHEMKSYDKALLEINKAIKIARTNGQSKALARALQKLAKYFVDTGEPEKAKKPLDESIKISKANNYEDILSLCYKTYANYHDPENLSDKSQEYLIKADRLNDSIFTKDLAEQFAETQTKYQTEKKEAQIRFLRQKKEIDGLKLKEKDASIFQQKIILGILITGLLSLSFMSYYYVNNQKLKAKIRQEIIRKTTEEQERSRIAKDIHDELGSGLSKIMFLSEMMNSPVTDEHKQKSSLKAVSETSRSLVENMRDLIWAMNPDNSTLDNLVARIREYSYDYLEELPLTFESEFPDVLPTMNISNELSRNVFMIVKESLQNIVKHAQAKTVKLEISYNGILEVTISDDGIGFDANSEFEGNGLRNLRNRSEAVGGKLIIESAPEKGTAIRFKVDPDKKLN